MRVSAWHFLICTYSLQNVTLFTDIFSGIREPVELRERQGG